MEPCLDFGLLAFEGLDGLAHYRMLVIPDLGHRMVSIPRLLGPPDMTLCMCSLCGWWLNSSLKLSLKGKGLQCQARQGRAAPHYYQLQAGQGNGSQPPTIHSELTFLVPGALAQGSLELGAPDSASCAAQSQKGLSHCLTHCEPPGCGDPRRRGPRSPKHQPTPCLA